MVLTEQNDNFWREIFNSWEGTLTFDAQALMGSYVLAGNMRVQGEAIVEPHVFESVFGARIG